MREKSKKDVLAFIVSSFTVFAIFALVNISWAEISVKTESTDAFASDRVIVKFRDGAALDNQNVLLDSLGLSLQQTLEYVGGISIVEVVSGDKSIEEIVEELNTSSIVEYAEPDHFYQIQLTPNDPSYSLLWGLHNTGQTGGTADADIDAPEAWDITTGDSDVVVAVCDTGIDYTHPDLLANRWINPGEVVNGFDDDGNGYIDDIYGIDAYNGDSDPWDDHSHGTHVSGTIGAHGNNGTGVVGVNWNVKIMALKMCSGGGSCSSSAAVTTLNYAIMMKQTKGINIILTSNSWGGGSYNQALKDAIEASGDAGMLFVAAAGNGYGNNNDTYPHYPSSYDSPNIIAVASTNHNDGLATHSNYGPTSVDLAAPGESIYSTVPVGSYGYKTGTSMATPHVSGAAALVKAVNPGLDWSGLKACILDNVDPLSSLVGRVLTEGRLNAYNSVSNCQPIECDYCLTDSYGYDWCLEVIGTNSKAYYLAGTVDVGSYTIDAISTYVYNGTVLNMTALGGTSWGDFNYNTRFTTSTHAQGNWVDESGGHGSVGVNLVDCGTAAAVEPEQAGPKPGMSR